MAGRPREHDPEAVLDAAMHAFWQRGYDGTSMRDLVAACGITTRSMYDSFGHKDHFFAAALDRYRNKVLSPLVGLLESERGLGALRRFTDVLAANLPNDGCLFVNTAAQRNVVKRSALARVERHFAGMRALFRAKLEEARADGDFRGDADARAAQLVATIAGLALAVRLGFSRDDVRLTLTKLLEDIGTT